MKGLRAKATSIASAAAFTAAVLAGGASCRSARPYLDPRGPVYTGSFALPEEPVREPPPGPSGEEDKSRRLHVVTFNVEYALRVEQALRALRENEHLRGADLVALQEMDAPGTEAIARGLGLNYVYYPASVHPKYERDVGNAILTPWPIERTFKLPLPHRSRGLGQSRLAAGAIVRVDGRPLRVYSLHLGSPLGASPGQRREQLQVVLCDAEESPEPVVIAGDFNSKGLGERLVAAGYRWLTRDVGPTAHRFSFDHVFVRGVAYEESRAGVAREVEDASDHRPVWVRLRGIAD
jgi:endonuclease/exonuclease/phosphatase family metal-dependent hydrolase